MSKKRAGVAQATLSTFCEIRRGRSQKAKIAAINLMRTRPRTHEPKFCTILQEYLAKLEGDQNQNPPL